MHSGLEILGLGIIKDNDAPGGQILPKRLIQFCVRMTMLNESAQLEMIDRMSNYFSRTAAEAISNKIFSGSFAQTTALASSTPSVSSFKAAETSSPLEIPAPHNI